MRLKSKVKELLASFLYSLAERLNPCAKRINAKDNVEFTISEKKGRVVKITAPAEYDPEKPIKKGGKIVRIMPKQLKKIKEAQEHEM